MSRSALSAFAAAALLAGPVAAAGHVSRMLDLGGRMTEVIEWGEGNSVIVLVHGANASPHMFDGFAPRFADDHRLIAYARRGHGKATPPSEPFDLDDLVEDLRTVMDRLGVARAVLMGHSFGGNEITRFAALYPDRVAGLVYLDAHYEMNENTLWAEVTVNFVSPPCAVEMASRDDLRACLADYLLAPLPWSETVEALVQDMLVDTAGPPVYKTTAEHVIPSMTAINEGYRREYEKLRASALFVMSETFLTARTTDEAWNRRYLDWIASSGYHAAQAWWVKQIRGAMPTARIVTIEGGTHDFIVEFEQTIDEVDRFLASIR